MQIHRLDDVRCRVGEGPLWDTVEQDLLHVDIVGQRLYRLRPDTEETTSIDLPRFIVAASRDEAGRMVVVLADGVQVLDETDGSLTPVGSIVLHPAEQLNDAKVDRQGRLVVIGSDKAQKDPVGILYQVRDDGAALALDHGFIIGNGPCWNAPGTVFYVADSIARLIYAYDYDIETGIPANRRVFADTTALGGIPDGATVDADGGLWMAMCGAGLVVRFTPDGAIDRRIEMPTAWVSSVAFGGPALDRLYVTSLDPGVIGIEGDAGCGYLYRIDEPGAVGLAERRIRPA